MLRRSFLVGLFFAGSSAVGALPPPSEQARIERLIRLIETHPSAQFLRNGKAYTPSEAGRFLRGKLAKMGEHVNTAQDFIDQIASQSSTTGQAYQIRLPGGRTVTSGEFLSDELKRMDR